MEDVYEITKKDSRQGQIASLDVGDTVAICRRVEMQYGFAPGAIAKHTNQVRGNLGQQADRARRQFKDRKFELETGSFMTTKGHLHIVATLTRTE